MVSGTCKKDLHCVGVFVSLRSYGAIIKHSEGRSLMVEATICCVEKEKKQESVRVREMLVVLAVITFMQMF